MAVIAIASCVAGADEASDTLRGSVEVGLVCESRVAGFARVGGGVGLDADGVVASASSSPRWSTGGGEITTRRPESSLSLVDSLSSCDVVALLVLGLLVIIALLDVDRLSTGAMVVVSSNFGSRN
ncbi:hypothetical protein ON010_g19069 [Phytophthora cinnamomi]|nr:hypothetical protein ON010_g19069 [Phytophthora cinnamomi]